MAKDYYEILGVSKEASKEEIKKAYKKLARKYHPDVSKEEGTEQKFKDINEAAGVLLDEGKRKQYDTFGSADGPQGMGGGFGSGGFDPRDFGINLDDIFEQFGFGGFGSGGFGGFSQGQRSGKDTRVYQEISISLDDVYFGSQKDITISRDEMCEVCDGKGTKNPNDLKTCETCNGQGMVIETQRSILGAIRTQRPCPTCKGTGNRISNPCSSCNGEGTKKKKETITLKIPKGIEDGVTLRVTGKGSYNPDSKTYGDLYVGIRVKNNKDYEVEGSNLYKSVEINFIQAILGDEFELDHFDKTLKVKIPQGTQSGTVLRLKNKGLPDFNYSSHGDLYLKVSVQIPTKVTTKQKEILLEYAKTLKDKSFLSRLKNMFS